MGGRFSKLAVEKEVPTAEDKVRESEEKLLGKTEEEGVGGDRAFSTVDATSAAVASSSGKEEIKRPKM